MTTTPFLKEGGLPFCKGCGHSHVTNNTEKALQKLGLHPLDVVLVTDIGCHGIVDKSFLTHTVHGLHGRAVALAGGVFAGLEDPTKKVIAFIGDGGATIGMQHLVGAAHRGFDITVVVHNNMLYGMTGGQPSDFTPCGFKTPTVPDGQSRPGHDICELITAAGASYVQRLIGVGDYSDALATAFSTKGFALIEVMELCPSHGIKMNPGMKVKQVVENAGLDVKVFASENGNVYSPPTSGKSKNLLGTTLEIEPMYTNSLDKRLSVVLAGSAGGGVQSAADWFAKAAMMSGLHVTLRGSYPVTVGVGFSASQINVSPEPILYTGWPTPEVLILTSVDGANYAQATAAKMQSGLLIADENLDVPPTGAEVIRVPFSARVGTRDNSVYGLLWLLNRERYFPLEAMMEVLTEPGRSHRVKLEKLLQF
ncbi:thiamine pyrophosphate-dependent enzyme [Gemmatimonadota bacterium]